MTNDHLKEMAKVHIEEDDARPTKECPYVDPQCECPILHRVVEERNAEVRRGIEKVCDEFPITREPVKLELLRCLFPEEKQ